MSHALLFAESAGSIVGGFVLAVLTFMASRVAWDGWTRRQRRERLKRAFLVDCVATLKKMKPVVRELTKDSRLADETPSLANIRQLFAGVVLSQPAEDFKELLTLLSNPHESRIIVHYYDRWSRFFETEKRFSAVHDKLLQAAARQTRAGDAQNEVTAEYWVQVIGMQKEMRTMANDLCNLSCSLFRLFGPTNECHLSEYSENKWQSWKEFDAEWSEFK